MASARQRELAAVTKLTPAGPEIGRLPSYVAHPVFTMLVNYHFLVSLEARRERSLK